MLFCFMSFLLNTHYYVTRYSECHYAECCYAECRGAAERCTDIEVNFCKIWNFSSHSKKKNIFEQKFENMKTLSNFVFDISKIISYFHYKNICCYIWISKLACFSLANTPAIVVYLQTRTIRSQPLELCTFRVPIRFDFKYQTRMYLVTNK